MAGGRVQREITPPSSQPQAAAGSCRFVTTPVQPPRVLLQLLHALHLGCGACMQGFRGDSASPRTGLCWLERLRMRLHGTPRVCACAAAIWVTRARRAAAAGWGCSKQPRH